LPDEITLSELEERKMPESLMSPSSIKLFGRLIVDIQIVASPDAPRLGANNFLLNQLSTDPLPQLARIYAFSFEGAFYEIPKPPLFAVHGPGVAVGNWDVPSTLDQTGVAGRDWDFSGNNPHQEPAARVAGAREPRAAAPAAPTNDIRYWEYEKGDFSLRLDVDAGPFEQILLQMALRGGGGVSGAGVSGAGVSGAGVSGAGVSGAGVSGAGVSGAGVSGAGVSGAGVRR
jgi:hypothetical protein